MSRIAFAAVAAVLLASQPARAADVVDADNVRANAQAVAPVAVVADPGDPGDPGKWYLRGDIGYRDYSSPVIDPACGCFTDGNVLRGSPDFQIGVGYHLTANLRTDVTLDFTPNAVLTGTAHVRTDPTNPYDAPLRTELSTGLVMANVYYDFGGLGPWHPYAGAGVGVDTVWSAPIIADNRPHHGGSTEINPAAALMAGVSYDITKEWAIDAGYRYVWIGSGHSNGNDNYTQIRGHEVKAGVRYTFQ